MVGGGELKMDEGGARGRNEMFYLTTYSKYFITVIWHRTYGKGPFR